MAIKPSHTELNLLLEAYLNGTASTEERAFIEQYYDWFENKRGLTEQLTESQNRELIERVAQKIYSQTAPVHRIPVRKTYRWVAAAAAVLILVAGGDYWLTRETNKKQEPTQTVVNVKAPQSNRAMIRLGNGKTVYLDSAGNGQLAMQNGVELTKLADGRIAYSGNINTGTTAEIPFNTVINPNGSQAIHMTLPDGTLAWLNAGSSMTFPLAFAGPTRTISINGEAYLEVVHDAKHPFVVEKGNTSVTVLGTHFNVKAYDNDPSLKITLLEGSVKVQKDNLTQLLQPGQQAVVTSAHIELVKDADTDEATAWKNGYINFYSTDLINVLHEIERWYDITVEINGDASKAPHDFYMNVKRDAPLKDVLKVLDNSKIKYTYEEQTKKLTIIP